MKTGKKKSFHFLSPGTNTAMVFLIPLSLCVLGWWLWTADPAWRGGSAAAQGETDWGARDERARQSRDGVASHPVCPRLRGFLRLKTFNAETRKVLGKLERLVTIAGWRDQQKWIWGELSRPRIYYPKAFKVPGLWGLARSPRLLWHSLAPQGNLLNSPSYVPWSYHGRTQHTETQRETHTQADAHTHCISLL